MTDSEQIADLKKTVASLRDALVGLASGHTIALDSLGNPVVVYGSFTATGPSTSSHSHVVKQQCNSNPHAHHYLMQSGLCACQDHSWAR